MARQTNETTCRVAKGIRSLAQSNFAEFFSHGKGKKTSSMFPIFSLSDSIHASEHDFAVEKEPAHKFEVNVHSFHRSYNSYLRVGDTRTFTLHRRKVCTVFKIPNRYTPRHAQ